ncbi:hypothetical protein N665_0327s0012 [Sinapis alba]|nr:hypothetical protein N665_0327s0012 [Sinapis alba]
MCMDQTVAPRLPCTPPRPSARVLYRYPKLLVHSFIRHDTRDWDTNLLLEYFHHEDIPLILKLRPVIHGLWMDMRAWNYTKSGIDLVWALSDYPSIPGYFPRIFVYQNMSFLFWKKKYVVYMEPPFETFPWIFWYIWKARNDKIFNGKKISPMDALQLAVVEAECWRQANLAEDEEEEEIPPAPPLNLTPLYTPNVRPAKSMLHGSMMARISWIPRTRNLCADSLAKEARLSGRTSNVSGQRMPHGESIGEEKRREDEAT